MTDNGKSAPYGGWLEPDYPLVLLDIERSGSIKEPLPLPHGMEIIACFSSPTRPTLYAAEVSLALPDAKTRLKAADLSIDGERKTFVEALKEHEQWQIHYAHITRGVDDGLNQLRYETMHIYNMAEYFIGKVAPGKRLDEGSMEKITRDLDALIGAGKLDIRPFRLASRRLYMTAEQANIFQRCLMAEGVIPAAEANDARRDAKVGKSRSRPE